MKTIKKETTDDRPKFKLRIDAKTIITIRSAAALKAWKERYPLAILID